MGHKRPTRIPCHRARLAGEQPPVFPVPDVRLLAESATFALHPPPIRRREIGIEKAVHIADPFLLEVRRDDEQDAVRAVSRGGLVQDEPGSTVLPRSTSSAISARRRSFCITQLTAASW